MPNSPSPRLLIAASGTGGHVFPAVAIAEQLPDWEIEWLGVPDRMEVQLVQGRYRLHTVTMSGIQGPKVVAWGRSLSQLAGAILTIRRVLLQGRFQGILTTGGYIAAPTILAARSLGIPVILHESNALPGKVTRWLGQWCRIVALGSKQAQSALVGMNTQVVGTPVRAAFGDPSMLAESISTGLESLGIPDDVPLIAVVGGSQGARGLNRMVVKAAPSWLAAGAWIVHLTGDVDAAQVEAMAPRDPHYFQFSFWTDMAGLLRRADFAVSRAGAMTLAELIATDTPAILIPYPYAADDHQFVNAQSLVVEGAAEVFRELESNEAAVEQMGLQWIQDPLELQSRRERLRAMDSRDAAVQMAQLIQAEFKSPG